MGYLTLEEAYEKGLRDDDLHQARLDFIGDYCVMPEDEESAVDFDLGKLVIGDITIYSALHWPIPASGTIKDIEEYYIGKTHTILLEFYGNEDGKISKNRNPGITEMFETNQSYQINGYMERVLERKEKPTWTIGILRVPIPIVVRIQNKIFRVNEWYVLRGSFFSTLIGNKDDPFYESHMMFYNTRKAINGGKW